MQTNRLDSICFAFRLRSHSLKILAFQWPPNNCMYQSRNSNFTVVTGRRNSVDHHAMFAEPGPGTYSQCRVAQLTAPVQGCVLIQTHRFSLTMILIRNSQEPLGSFFFFSFLCKMVESCTNVLSSPVEFHSNKDWAQNS